MGQRVGEGGLAHAGHVFEEDVSPGQEGGDREADDRTLAVEHFLDLVHQALEEGE